MPPVLHQIVAHSVGTWNAYEFLIAARAAGLPMPVHVFLSAMASPDIPVEKRPWRQQKTLAEDEFKARAIYLKFTRASCS